MAENISVEIMEYLVWVIELAAGEFFNGDKTLAYEAMKKSKLWNIYIDHYDLTHTLGAEYLLDEMREYFVKNGVEISC